VSLDSFLKKGEEKKKRETRLCLAGFPGGRKKKKRRRGGGRKEGKSGLSRAVWSRAYGLAKGRKGGGKKKKRADLAQVLEPELTAPSGAISWHPNGRFPYTSSWFSQKREKGKRKGEGGREKDGMRAHYIASSTAPLLSRLLSASIVSSTIFQRRERKKKKKREGEGKKTKEEEEECHCLRLDAVVKNSCFSVPGPAFSLHPRRKRRKERKRGKRKKSEEREGERKRRRPASCLTQ